MELSCLPACLPACVLDGSTCCCAAPLITDCPPPPPPFHPQNKDLEGLVEQVLRKQWPFWDRWGEEWRADVQCAR
jgi:hypothetical protein